MAGYFKNAHVSVSDVYQASREVCSRMHRAATEANRAWSWTVHPYPQTAAISMDTINRRASLYMPAMPMHALMSRAQADMMLAYVVHETGHALYTSFSVWEQAKKEGLTAILNGLEDVRIEKLLAKAKHLFADAFGMLEMLAEHVTAKAMANKWQWTDPANLAFGLYQYACTRNLGYKVPSMPRSDRLPLELATILEYGAREIAKAQNTNDALNIARQIANMARCLPKPQPQQGQPGQGQQGQGQQGQGQGAGGQGEGEEGEGEGNGAGARQAGDGSQTEPGEGKGAGTGASLSYGNVNPSDAVQISPEVNLQDIADAVCAAAGADAVATEHENRDLTAWVNVGACDTVRTSSPLDDAAKTAALANAIPAPARLRRDVRLCVKSPERNVTHRHEAHGRFDMRDMGRARAGAVNVFRRREDEEGRNAGVSLLLDLSSSMQGANIDCAVALALQLGDALKAVNAPFAVSGFLDGSSKAFGSRVLPVKKFRDPWQTVRNAVGGMTRTAQGGTAMMPAIHHCARELAGLGGVSRRILLVLADGGDGYSIASNRACIAAWKARGVEVVMIGCLTDVSAYGAAHANVLSLPALASGGLGALVKVLGGAQ